MRTLDYVHAHNLAIEAGVSSAWLKATVPVYEAVRTVDYPRYDDGTLSAMVHPSIQGRDFAISLRKGDPVFLTMGGETLGFEPSDKDEEAGEACVPFFVNEAAYYEKGIAFMIAHQQQQPVRVLAAEPQCFDERVAKKSRRCSSPMDRQFNVPGHASVPAGCCGGVCGRERGTCPVARALWRPAPRRARRPVRWVGWAGSRPLLITSPPGRWGVTRARRTQNQN